MTVTPDQWRVLITLRNGPRLRGDILRILYLELPTITTLRRQGLIEYLPGQGRPDYMCLTQRGRSMVGAGDGGGARHTTKDGVSGSTDQSFMGSVNTTGWNRDSGNPPAAGDGGGA